MDLSVKLRESTSDDNWFLYLLFADVRRRELAPLGWTVEQQNLFIQNQFTLQQKSYREQFPDAKYSIVQDTAGGAIGAILVTNGKREIRVVDVTLTAAVRGRGIGGELLRSILARGKKARLPVRLSVLQGNRAINLYRRLGFRETGVEAGGMYLGMEKLPDS
jgi:ribosomal protein S18 acetylase RimI-like enzyme